jgi:hypothetical protein
MANQTEIREMYEQGCNYDEIASELFLSEENWNNGNPYEGYPIEGYSEIFLQVTQYCTQNAEEWEAERAEAENEDLEYMRYEGN